MWHGPSWWDDGRRDFIKTLDGKEAVTQYARGRGEDPRHSGIREEKPAWAVGFSQPGEFAQRKQSLAMAAADEGRIGQ